MTMNRKKGPEEDTNHQMRYLNDPLLNPANELGIRIVSTKILV